jgi:hypothetical protein
MSKKDLTDESKIDDSEQPQIMKAVIRATGAKSGTLHLTLMNEDNTEVDLPFKPVPHIVHLQAQRGEKYVSTTEEDDVDTARNIRVAIKKFNSALQDGWAFVNDTAKSPTPQKTDIANKKIAIGDISTGDWSMMEYFFFPGSDIRKKDFEKLRCAVFGQK